MVDHPLVLRGPNFLRADARPAVLQRTDQEFIPGVLSQLASANGRQALAGTLAPGRDRDGGMKLFQPVHRTFHVTVVEAACTTFGVGADGRPRSDPKLDPKRIESAGIVVRREGAKGPEGWMQAGHQLRGWVPFRAFAEKDLDPDLARRRPAARAGHAGIDEQLALLQGPADPFTEATTALFVAPPDVCRSADRTLLYGLVPVTSSERSEAADDAKYPLEFVRERLEKHLPTYLRPRNATRRVPRAGQTLNASAAADTSDTFLQGFIGMLRQVGIEFEAFADTPPARTLNRYLNDIALPYDTGTRPAGDVLNLAFKALVKREPNQTVEMPTAWPAITEAQGEAIALAVKEVLDARLSGVLAKRGRYDDPAARYRLRAFVRVARGDGCPPELVWSEPSDPFSIAPWYDNGPLPPVPIVLPDPTKAFIEQVKPNVAFQVPGGLFNTIQANTPAKDLLDGDGKKGAGGDLDWICGFNIAIITICAFIVLSIFLQLLDIVFQWMFFVKICVPVP